MLRNNCFTKEIINVGQSKKSSKIIYIDKLIPNNSDIYVLLPHAVISKENWLTKDTYEDKFHISVQISNKKQEKYQKIKITFIVTRIDSNCSWDMDLTFECLLLLQIFCASQQQLNISYLGSGDAISEANFREKISNQNSKKLNAFIDFMKSPIDIIILWVDLNNPDWKKKYQKYVSTKIDKERYYNNNELELCLYTINKYMNWVRNIFIITECQLPEYTSKYKNIKTINSSILLKNVANIPSFNSNVIESNFHKIPGLSEIFLFGCDDFFVGKKIEKSEWFDFESGLPSTNLREIIPPKIIKTYWYYLYNANLLSKINCVNSDNKFLVPSHQFGLLTKKSCQKGWELNRNELLKMGECRTRSPQNIQITSHLFFQLIGFYSGFIHVNIERGVEFSKEHPFGYLTYDGHIKKEEYAHFLNNIKENTPKFYCLNHLTEKCSKNEFTDFKKHMMNK